MRPTHLTKVLTYLTNLTRKSHAGNRSMRRGQRQRMLRVISEQLEDRTLLSALSISDASVIEGNTGTAQAVFTVTLSEAATQTVTVIATSANNTAVAPVDYAPLLATTLTFAPGELSKTISVAVNGDMIAEADETFFVNLTAAMNATFADSQGVGTIVNDDPAVTVSIGDASVVEGNSGTTTANFSVSLSAASSQTVTVSYATADGTATAPADYSSVAATTLSFAPGETSKVVSVTVNGDATNETNETFFVNLTGPTNAVLADDQGVGTIVNDDPAPTISINDVSVVEGNSGTVNAVFTVTLSSASSQTVTAVATSTDDTATAPADYSALLGTTVTFAPGETSKTVTVSVNGDTLIEEDETLFVNLTAAINATFADNQGVGTIINDDPLPSLSITDVSVVEGNSGTTAAAFTVTLSAASSDTVTVNYATANGTAVAPGDYATVPSTALTFEPGETTKTFGVTVNGDAFNEADETFFVNLSSATNATVADGQGIGTIINDDPVPTLSINDVSVVEGDSGTVNAVFTITLSAASTQTVTVFATTADDTATAPVDYTAAGPTLFTFAPGELTKTFTVLVNGDNDDEQDETFFVNLTAALNADVSDSQGVGTIQDDDPEVPPPVTPSISINDVSVVEGNSGTVNAMFTVTLSTASSQTVTVLATSANGTATTPADYVALVPTTVTFAPGVTNQSVTVLVNGDSFNEANETFFVNLSAEVNATIGDAQGVGTIINDDPLPTLSINDISIVEGNFGPTSANFTVTLSAASSQTVTVSYATVDGTAAAPGDYVPLSLTTLTFAPGETSKPITVLVNGDTTNETNETFFVNLSNSANAAIADNQGQATITNDDPAPALSIDDVYVVEGNSGTVTATFTVTLSAASSQTVTVIATSADGTASAPGDYTAVPATTVTFAPGQTSQTVSVSVNGDTLIENDETYFVSLTAATNASIADDQGLGAIINDDPVPTISINDVSVVEGNSGTANATFTISLSKASDQTITVTYGTADGTATSPADYTGTSPTVLTFAPGETSKPVTVAVKGDTANEANETFFVQLINTTNATIADDEGQATIVNDDPSPTISISNVTVVEGHSGTVNATFTISLSAASTQTVTVVATSANDTATVPSDYTSLAPTTVTFAPGETSKTINVAVNGDTERESNETFFVNLTAALNATVADDQGAATILDDDLRMFRVYNPNADLHVYMTSEGEFNALVSIGYHDETSGKGGFNVVNAGTVGSTPLHRLYNPFGSQHYLTYDDAERDHLVSLGWKFEKEEGNIYVTQGPGTLEIFRLYNVNTGDHVYLVDNLAKNAILAQFPGIWEQHASLGYGFAAPSQGTPQPATAAEVRAAATAPIMVTAAAETTSQSTLEVAADEPEQRATSEASTSSETDVTSNTTTNEGEETAPTVAVNASESSSLDLFWEDVGQRLNGDLAGMLELELTA